MKPNIGITEKNLTAIAGVLSRLLANQIVLYTKTRKFHWNVSGESFIEIHRLFEEHYKQLEEEIDEVAERINKLGSKTIGTMQEFKELATINEAPGKYPAQKAMLQELLDDHETLIKELRKDIETCDEKYKDAGTTDFLTKLMEDHESTAWMLRRYLS